MGMPMRLWVGGTSADARTGRAPGAADGIPISEVPEMKRIVSAALAAVTVLAVSSVASSSPSSPPSRDEAALAPTRGAPSQASRPRSTPCSRR